VEEKVKLPQSALLNEVFIIEWKKEGNEYIINEVTCPFITSDKPS
jgi:predicted ArsR family transcriptional regulator